MYPYHQNSTMFDPMYKPRGGFRGSPRGGRGRGGSWSNQGGSGGYYGGSQMDGGYRGRGGGYRGGQRGASQGGGYHRSNDSGYRGGGGGGYRGGYRGGMQQGGGGYGGRSGSGGYHSSGYMHRGGPRGGGMGGGGGGYRGGMGGGHRGGMDYQNRAYGRPSNNNYNKKSDSIVFEEELEHSKRLRMVKVTFDSGNKLHRAEFEHLFNMDGVTDVFMSGNMVAEYKDSQEDLMLQTFQDVEQITQNGIPCYVDLTGKRSKTHGKESVRNLRRVDVRNLPEKTTIETVKEAFPNALSVWKCNRFNFIEMLFANEEEACEAILSGQQKEINGVLPYVMFHRENQADLVKRPREEEQESATSEPPAKKAKSNHEEETSEKENGNGGEEDENGEQQEDQ